jgi:hypothetical protein
MTRYKSMDLQGESTGPQFPDTIPATLKIEIDLESLGGKKTNFPQPIL